MIYIGLIIALCFVAITAYLLVKNYNPHAVLIILGLLMMAASAAIGFPKIQMKEPTGLGVFDFFATIVESFSKINANVGLMIMAIGGFVAYMKHIGASDALVTAAMRPLHLLKKYPDLTAIMVIPIGQILFICIPSAAGLSLLLMAAVFPILVNLGVSRAAAVSVITSCTTFGMGPASALTASATEISGEDPILYFLTMQLPLMIPSSIVMMIAYYFTNRFFDKREKVSDEEAPELKEHKPKVNAPKIYALLPIIPLILLIVFSEIFNITGTVVKLDTTNAMIISLFVALIAEFIRLRDVKKVFDSLKVFWNGMGDIFKSVVTLIIAAEVFSVGLISLGFIDGLIQITEHLGFGAVGIGIAMTLVIFLSSMLMGSGNAAFFAFAPLIPKIASKLGVKSTEIILPMNLSASLGRTISPVAGIIIACGEIAGVSAFAIVKRNLIPISAAFITMLIIHYF